MWSLRTRYINLYLNLFGLFLNHKCILIKFQNFLFTQEKFCHILSLTENVILEFIGSRGKKLNQMEKINSYGKNLTFMFSNNEFVCSVSEYRIYNKIYPQLGL